MRPQNKQLRVVELLPGGEQITSRPLRVVAHMDDRGVALVQKTKEGDPADMLGLLATLLAATAMWFDAPPATVAHRAVAGADHICAQEARDE
jgi:hypothetical protein